jgi:hypothetical protein
MAEHGDDERDERGGEHPGPDVDAKKEGSDGRTRADQENCPAAPQPRLLRPTGDS